MTVYPTPREFTKVNLELTTACNLTCPDCSAGTNGSGLRKVVHHPWEYFADAARWLQGIDSVVVIGGEPTAHPKFAEIAPKLRELFGCRELILWTNGFKVEKFRDLIKRTFDLVYASIYDAESGHEWNKKTNRVAVELIQPDAIAAAPHVPFSRRGSGQICERVSMVRSRTRTARSTAVASQWPFLAASELSLARIGGLKCWPLHYRAEPAVSRLNE